MANNANFGSMIKSVFTGSKVNSGNQDNTGKYDDTEYDYEAVDDEYSDDDSQYDNDYDEPVVERSSRMYDLAEDKAGKLIDSRRKKVDRSSSITQIDGKSTKGNADSNKIIYVNPQNIDSAYSLIEYIKDKKTVVMILEGINDSEAQRIVDFMSGAICALSGNISRVSSYIFVITPYGVENIDKRTESKK